MARNLFKNGNLVTVDKRLPVVPGAGHHRIVPHAGALTALVVRRPIRPGYDPL
jgi:hypothetical protein